MLKLADLSSVLSGAITGVVGLSGILATYFGGSRDAKLRNDIRVEETKRAREERVYPVYNKVLQFDGEHFVIELPPGETLDIKMYRENVRAVLFSSLHVLHQDVRDQIHALDDTIGSIIFMANVDEVSQEDEYKAMKQYSDLIQLIKGHYHRHD